MKVGRIVLVGIFILIIGNSISKAQDVKTFYTDNYQRAMRYNDRAEAKSALYKLVALEPQNDSLLVNLAYMYLEVRQYASSVLICMDALAINPENTGALEIIAVSYENLGLKDKALDNFEKLYLETDDFQTLYRMAFLQYDLEKYLQCSTNIDILMQAPEAAEATASYTFEEEEKEFSIKVPLINLKGLVNVAQGNNDLAKQNFEEALQLAPDFILAQQNLDDLNK